VNQGTTEQVSIDVAATPDAVYDVVTDVSRMGEWSPECHGGKWVRGATGPAVGARFRGTNRRGLARWQTTPKVVAADRGKEFAFVVSHLGREMTRWTYRFAPSGSGTTLSESFEILNDLPPHIRFFDRYAMGVKDRRADLVENMRHTIGRIKAAVEAGTGTPSS
jgi:hypothetical protein